MAFIFRITSSHKSNIWRHNAVNEGMYFYLYSMLKNAIFPFWGGGRHGDKAQKSIVCVFYFVDMHFTKWTCNGVICRSLSLQQRKEEEAPFYLSFGGKKRKETHLVFFPHIKSFVLGVCCSFFAIDWLAHMKQPRKADAPPPPAATTQFFAHLSWWRTWGWRGSWSRCRPGCWARAATPSCSSAAARWGSGSRSLWCRDRTTPRCRPARCPPPPAGSSESWRRRPWPGGGLGNKKTGGLFFFFFLRLYHFWEVSLLFYFFFAANSQNKSRWPLRHQRSRSGCVSFFTR